VVDGVDFATGTVEVRHTPMIMLSEGTIFAGRYRVVRLIGQGGMGAVFEVVHVETERRCALKVMQPNMVDNDAMRARFRQEAKVAALVNSEHIVDVYDAGVDEATQMPFLVMELLSGIELRQQLKTRGPMRPDEVALYLYQTALALEKTHRSNIIHRDLKPENLFLTFRENGAPHIKILDFGVAKFMTEPGAHTNATRDVGTPLYMGPEQFTMGAKPSPQTDIYALGMIAYTLLTGVTYWADDMQGPSTIYAFAMHVIKGPTEPATVRALRRGVRLPPAFDLWFARATARDPQQRFQSALVAANELADALGIPRMAGEPSMAISNAGMRAVMGSSWGGAQSTGWTGAGAAPITAEPANATGAPLATTAGTRKESKGRLVLAAAGGMTALLLVGGILLFTRGSSPSSPVSAAPTDNVNAPPSAAVTAATTAPASPTIAPIPDPAVSASATSKTSTPKTTSKSTTPAKPVTTSIAPKKDLFTRD